MGDASIFRRLRLPERLPALTRWAMTAYVALWLALLPVAVAVPLAGSWYRYHDGAGGARGEYPLGFDENDWVVTKVLGDEAAAAGLRHGDRIVAVDGVVVPRDPRSYRQVEVNNRLRVAEGAPVRLLVSSGHQPPRTLVLHHSAATAALFYRGSVWTAHSLSLASALILLIPCFVLVPGAIVLFGRRRDPGAALLSLTLLLLTQGPTWANLAWRHWDLLPVTTVISLIGTVCLFTSILSFPRGRFDPPWSAWLAILILLDGVVEQFVQVPPAIGNVFSAVVFCLLVLALALRYRGEAASERRQWRWALLGLCLGLALLPINALLYQPYLDAHADDTAVALWSWIVSPGLVSCAISLMIGGMLLSVMRYRIYAAQSAVSRSLVYGSLTLALLAVFAASEKIVELVGEEYFGESLGALAGGLGAAFAAVAIAPMHHRISHWFEQRLRKDLIFLRDRFPGQLMAAADDEGPEALAADALARACGALHAESGVIVGSRGLLAVHGIDRAEAGDWRTTPSAPLRLAIKRDERLPVRLPLGHDAVLLLGRKPDGSLYDKDEREALAALADPLGQALRHAARERRRDARLAGLEQEIGRLAAVLKPTAA